MAARVALGLWLLLLALPGQDRSGLALRATELDAGTPIADYALVTLRGTRRDVVLLTRDRRFVVFDDQGPGKGFAKPRFFPVPENAGAWGLVRLRGREQSRIIVLHAEGVDALIEGEDGSPRSQRIVDLPLVFPERPAGAPRFWTWGEDADGDDYPDLLLPGAEASQLVRGRGDGPTPFAAPMPIPVPATQRRVVGAAGALEVILRRPRVGLHALDAEQPPRALWLAADGVREVLGDARQGFRNESRLRFAFPREGGGRLGVLEQTGIDFADLDGDARLELVLSRTAAEEGGSLDLKTSLVFLPGSAPPVTRPRQVLRLPGVLSYGPYLRDLDGDERPDLFVTVFGGLRSEIARRLFRRVKMTSYVYLGREGRSPFGRSPDLTLEDDVPNAVFDTWAMRHRVLLSRDWNGDGLADVVRVSGGVSKIEVSLQPTAKKSGEGYALGTVPVTPVKLEGSFTGWSQRELHGSTVLVLKRETGLTLVSLSR